VDERELIDAAQRGDREAFEALVRETYLDTYTLACRLTGNVEDAHDVTQDAYLRAWRGIGKFRGEAQFSTWLYRITANAAATYTRKRRRNQTVVFDALNEPRDTRGEGQPAAMAEAGDLLERLTVAVDELPPKLRQVVVLRDVYGMAHEAIASELGITETAAKVRLHRARRKLRDVLVAGQADDADGASAHAV
jgi:RNA polymerase sigma-70 factor (ECF subfamily)